MEGLQMPGLFKFFDEIKEVSKILTPLIRLENRI